MVRVRPAMTVARAAGLAALAAPLLAAGCASTDLVTQRVSRAVKSTGVMGPAAPATQFICVWQRRLAPLPDPTRDGAMAPGIAGQMFLIDSEGGPADVLGDVTVALYDDTKRPDGMPAKTPEVFHFTRETVSRLRTSDERFGRSYVLYLPWPAGWQDVTTVRVLSRYEAPPVSLHSGEVRLALDLSEGDGPVWSESGGVPAAARPTGLDTRTVPDGAKVAVQQAQARSAAAPGPVVPAAVGVPQAPVLPVQAPTLVQPTAQGQAPKPGPVFVKSGVLPPPAPVVGSAGVLPPPSFPTAPAASNGSASPVLPPIIVGR